MSFLKFELTDERARAYFDGMPAKLHSALSRKITQLRLALEDKVKAKLSGPVLHVRTGNLRRSIYSDQQETATAIVGRVAQSADVPYGRIHEYGGKTAAHIILPKKAKALAFAMGGKQVFASIVHHPGSVMPERSYLRSSLSDMRQEIIDGIGDAVREGTR